MRTHTLTRRNGNRYIARFEGPPPKATAPPGKSRPKPASGLTRAQTRTEIPRPSTRTRPGAGRGDHRPAELSPSSSAECEPKAMAPGMHFPRAHHETFTCTARTGSLIENGGHVGRRAFHRAWKFDRSPCPPELIAPFAYIGDEARPAAPSPCRVAAAMLNSAPSLGTELERAFWQRGGETSCSGPVLHLQRGT